ncbi:MAG: site-specific integrase [Firmicutes bacterium]|nr:site-specific integrase [Bacillota bacterium]
MQGGVRKRGAKWYYYFDAGKVNGKRKKIERVGGRTKKEAQDALRKALNDFETGYTPPNKLTVYDYLNDWLENFIKENRKINTYNRYKGLLKNYIYPAIGNIKLKDLKPIQIDTMINEVRQSNISNSTLQHIYGTLNSGLNRAVKLRVLNDNPCKYVDRPKREKFTANVLTVEEFYKMLDLLNIDSYNDYIFSIALQIVLELGLRRGELSGLEWKNIDFENNTITIANNLIYSNGKTYLDTPKTEESKRTIYISNELKQLLRSHKKIQSEHRLKYGPYYIINNYNNQKYDFIMTWESGKHVHPLYYTQRFRRLLKRLGIERSIRFHDLRHTNATLLLSQGVDFKTIQIRLGHADINTTLNIYSHVDLEMQKKATEKLTNLLEGGKSVAKQK